MAVVVFAVYAFVDAALSPKSQVRGIPKWAWLIVVLVLPVLGGALWFLIGRPRRARRPAAGRTPSGASRRIVAPDDDLSFLNTIGRDLDQEERIRKLEQELSDLDEGGDADAGRRDA